MLTVLGGLAEFERELIMARTGEGRLRAKARGVRFGRPRSLTPHQRQEAMQRLADGEVQADLARSYGVSQATISRLSGDRPFEASAAAAQLSAEGRPIAPARVIRFPCQREGVAFPLVADSPNTSRQARSLTLPVRR